MNRTAILSAIILIGMLNFGYAHAKYDTDLSCKQGYGYIDGVGYSDAEYMPIIHIKDNSWSYLSYSQGVDKYYGRAMLSVALTAYATGRKVWIGCASADNANQIWMYP